MLYIPKIGYCLKILADNEVKDFVVINYYEYFKSSGKNYIVNLVRNKIFEKLLNHFISF